MTSDPRNRGFTLVELLVVVAIIGILAAIAYPSYQSHILKGNRASTQAFLLDAATRQQQYFLDNRAYAPDLGTLFPNTSPMPPSEVSPYYSITVATASGPPPTFMFTATPTGTQASGGEVTLTIDQAGQKLPSGKW